MIEGNLKIMKAGSLSALCVALATLTGCGSDDLDKLDRTQPVGTESLAVLTANNLESTAVSVFFPVHPKALQNANVSTTGLIAGTVSILNEDEPTLVRDPAPLNIGEDKNLVSVDPTVPRLPEPQEPNPDDPDAEDPDAGEEDFDGGVNCGLLQGAEGFELVCETEFDLEDDEEATSTVDPDEIFEVESEIEQSQACAIGGTTTITGTQVDTYLIKDEPLLRSYLQGRVVREDCVESANVLENSSFAVEFSDNFETGRTIYQRSLGQQSWTDSSTGATSTRDYGFLRTTRLNGEEVQTFSYEWTSSLFNGDRVLVTTLEPLVYPVILTADGSGGFSARTTDVPTAGKVRIQGGDDSEIILEVVDGGIADPDNGGVYVNLNGTDLGMTTWSQLVP